LRSEGKNPGGFVRKLLVAALVLLLGACSHVPVEQSDAHVLPQEEVPQGKAPPPVQFSTILPKPKPAVRPETYSVVVNGVKVQELLFALARDAKLNIDVHPGIAGTVTLNAVDQTLQQLLSRISKQVDMRWELDGPNLAVMPDSPYLRIYKIDYLNMDRTTQGTVGVSTQIATPGTQTTGAGGGAAGGANQSTTTVQNKADNKFWERLVENIKDILRETDKVLPAPGPPGAGQLAAAPGAAPGGALQQLAAAAGVGTGAPPPGAASAPNVTFREAASVISNPEAGVLTIRATSRQHEKIQEFLDQVLVNARRQVLIEATIAEVQLNNQYQQGIDWSKGPSGSAGFNVSQNSAGTPAGVSPPPSPIFNLVYTAANVSASIKLLESFGNVRVLSSPRLSVVNNQTAILKVVDNEVYFTIKADTIVSSNVAATTTFTTTPNIVPVGFVMNITPQISDTDVVLLNVKPTVSTIIRSVLDPNPALANPCGSNPPNIKQCESITSSIPVIQTREMESLIKVNSGQIAVLGGLIQDSIKDVEDVVPVLGSLPGIGALFTQRKKVNAKTELVIFLRPVVVRDPSLDGDFRSLRSMAPDENFISQPNPGRARPLEIRP
jgi:general secretion pathway protein D